MHGTQSPKVNRNLSSRPGVRSQLDGLQGLQKCRVAKPPEGRNIDIYQVMLWQCLLGESVFWGDVKHILWYIVVQGVA